MSARPSVFTVFLLVATSAAFSFLLLLAFQNSASAPINSDQPLNVCDVLKNLQDYRGKTISVRGEWSGGDLEGNCKIFTNRIVLKFPSHLTRYGIPADWRWDETGIAEAKKKYEGLLMSGHDIVATFTGQLDALPPEYGGRGFGHLNKDPAELLLISISDVVSKTGKPVRPPIKKIIPIE